LDDVYLPAIQRLAAGQTSSADQTLLDSFCDSIHQAGWPLRSQLRDSGWGQLRVSLATLSQLLGPVPSVSVINVPEYSGDQSRPPAWPDPHGQGGTGGGDSLLCLSPWLFTAV
jgi:hypothetical protein